MVSKYALSAFLVLCCTACAGLPWDFSSPEVELTYIKPLNASMRRQSVEVGLRLQNPNATDIPIAGMRYVVTINQVRVANGALTEPFVLSANGIQQVKVQTEISLLEAFKGLGLGRRQWPNALNYELQGELYVDNPLVPALPLKHVGVVRLDKSQMRR